MPVSRSGARKIQSWFEFAGTYSYLAAMRIEHGDEAATLGIFGASSFLVGRELFRGNDRLDQTLAWATAP